MIQRFFICDFQPIRDLIEKHFLIGKDFFRRRTGRAGEMIMIGDNKKCFPGPGCLDQYGIEGFQRQFYFAGLRILLPGEIFFRGILGDPDD